MMLIVTRNCSLILESVEPISWKPGDEKREREMESEEFHFRVLDPLPFSIGVIDCKMKSPNIIALFMFTFASSFTPPDTHGRFMLEIWFAELPIGHELSFAL
ncbi:hypothetical protein V6N12_043339 [Hibiscus sabdariffa]|uniref:Uncharacterized protein n=1 Tax=Hibiscus sabdariffa TaxID=183260 RepID=A0ABR2DE37_9ROSI